MSLTKEDLLAISQLFETVLETKLSPILDTMLDAKLDAILDSKLDAMLDAKLDAMLDAKLDAMLDSKLDTILDAKLQPIREDIHELKARVSDIELTLENEISRNIRIIAEGHLDLNRKLDEALKISNEKEILLLRMSHLENELRQVKERISQIA